MMEQKEHKIQIVVLSLLDITGIMISFLSANYIRNRRFWYENIDIELSTAILYMILLYLLLAFLKNSKQDFFKRGSWEELVEVTAKVTQYTALLIASMFCFKIASEISRIAFFLFYIFAITLVFVFRSIYKGFLLHVAKKSINTKRLVILTMAENVEEIKKKEVRENELYKIFITRYADVIETIKKYDYPGNAAGEVADILGITRDEVGFIYDLFDPTVFVALRLQTIEGK